MIVERVLSPEGGYVAPWSHLCKLELSAYPSPLHRPFQPKIITHDISMIKLSAIVSFLAHAGIFDSVYSSQLELEAALGGWFQLSKELLPWSSRPRTSTSANHTLEESTSV